MPSHEEELLTSQTVRAPPRARRHQHLLKTLTNNHVTISHWITDEQFFTSRRCMQGPLHKLYAKSMHESKIDFLLCLIIMIHQCTLLHTHTKKSPLGCVNQNPSLFRHYFSSKVLSPVLTFPL